MNKKFNFLKENKLFGSFGIYVGSALINSAIPFLLLPVFTYYLSTTDYGIVSMFAILCGLFMPFVGLSTASVLGREFFNQDKIEFSQYLGNVLFILVLSFLPFSFIVIIFSNEIAQLSEIPKEILWLVLVFSFFSFLVNIVLTIWQVQSKAKKYGFFQLVQTLINLVLSIVLVVGLKWGWEGRVLAQVLAVVCSGCFGFFILVKNNYVKFKFDRVYFNDALKFGIPLIPHSLGAIIISMSDRMIITNMVGIEATGIYAVGYSIGSIIGFVEHSFNLAYAPWLFEKLNLNDYNFNLRIVKFTYLYFIGILLLVVFLTLASPFIFKFFIDQKFANSQGFVFWIALSFAFSGMYKMVTNYIFYVKKTQILAWITFGSAILNVILNYFLIKVYGAVGAAISAAIVSFCFFIFTWILSNRVYEMPWGIKWRSTK